MRKTATTTRSSTRSSSAFRTCSTSRGNLSTFPRSSTALSKRPGGAVEAERKERARKEREAAREDLERWINNGTTYPPPSCQTDETGSVYLRLTPDGMVETSRSARVPLHSALRLYKLCIKTKEAGKSLDAHNRPLRVGFYTLTSIAANGDAIVGCHRISFDRMTDLFEKLPESVRIANVSPMGEDGPDDVAANTL